MRRSLANWPTQRLRVNSERNGGARSHEKRHSDLDLDPGGFLVADDCWKRRRCAGNVDRACAEDVELRAGGHQSTVCADDGADGVGKGRDHGAAEGSARERYDLTDRPPGGVRAKLPAGVTWDQLGGMSPADVRAKKATSPASTSISIFPPTSCPNFRRRSS
jgi:hypothetical protein